MSRRDNYIPVIIFLITFIFGGFGCCFFPAILFMQRYHLAVEAATSRHFEKNGTLETAVITKKYITQRSTGRGGNTDVFMIEYRLDGADEPVRESIHPLDFHLWQVGEQIEVLSIEPSVHRIKHRTRGTPKGELWMAAASVGFVSVGVFLIWLLFRLGRSHPPGPSAASSL